MVSSKKRTIEVRDENNKVVYKGDDNRLYGNDYPKCLVGIPISDWMKTGSVIVAFIVMFTTMRLDLGNIKVSCNKFEAYIENHDDWDSAFFHVRFKDGEPLDKRFDGATNPTQEERT